MIESTILGVVALAFEGGRHDFPALMFGAWAVHPGKRLDRWRVTHAPSGLRIGVGDPDGDAAGDVEWCDAVAIAEEMRVEFGDSAVEQIDRERGHAAIQRGLRRAEAFMASTGYST